MRKSIYEIDGYEWVRITTQRTDLPYDILADSLGAERAGTFPMVYVKTGDELVAVTVAKKPVVVDDDFELAEQMLEWISNHYQSLRSANRALERYY
ncbi:MAG: hypothetical protein IK093_08200 [Ruminiclostridium sp.]|nr:hypothetical protein [Ruminiclostridium sp.]